MAFAVLGDAGPVGLVTIAVRRRRAGAVGPDRALRVVRARAATVDEWQDAHEAHGASYFHGPAWARLWERSSGGAVRLEPLVVELCDGSSAVVGASSVPTRLPGVRQTTLSPEGCAGGFVGAVPLDAVQRAAVARWLAGRRSLLWRIGAVDADLHEVVAPVGRVESTHLIDLADGAEGARSRFRSSAKRSARRAASAGVVVRRATGARDWETYVRLYADTVRRWDTPLGTYDERVFELLADEPGDGVSPLPGGARGRACAGEIVLVHRDHAISWHGATDTSAVPGSFNLLEWEVVGDLAADGVRVYDLNGSAGLEGVVAFKESCGRGRRPCWPSRRRTPPSRSPALPAARPRRSRPGAGASQPERLRRRRLP
ncbi:MAG: GNAT family N-acetyltransferase [Thermoleophilia bacterium]